MSYAVKDRSIHDGAPIECYEFVASHKTWRFTSYHTAVTVDGDLYTPLPITRSAIDVGSVIDALQTMDFNIPCDHELAQTFCYTISPKELAVTVKRVHEGDDFATDFRVEWKGDISGASASGKWATIKTAGKFQTKLNGNTSSVFYQRTCNHVLFDVRCKVVKASFTTSALVVKVQGQIITVDNDDVANGDLIAGEMLNTRTGEVQGIIDNITNVLRIGYRFFDIVVGDFVDLTQGCDHQRLGHCKNRFNNVDNYGGFDHVPERNPFEQLNYAANTSITTRVRREQEQKFSIPPTAGRQV